MVRTDVIQGCVVSIGAQRTRPAVAGDQHENSWANKAVSQNTESAYFQFDPIA